MKLLETGTIEFLLEMILWKSTFEVIGVKGLTSLILGKATSLTRFETEFHMVTQHLRLITVLGDNKKK